MRLLRSAAVALLALGSVMWAAPVQADQADPAICFGEAQVGTTSATLNPWLCSGVPQANHNEGLYTIVLTFDPPLCDSPGGNVTSVDGHHPTEGDITGGSGQYIVWGEEMETWFTFTTQSPQKQNGLHAATARFPCPPGGFGMGWVVDVT